MRASFALFAMAAAAVSAQTTIQTYNSSLDMTIDPGTVDIDTRSDWCNGQEDTCDTLCEDDTKSNDCFPETLKWDCTCSSNSSTPGLQFYTQTMPTFICQTLFAQCIAENTSSQRGQRECKTKINELCATQGPPKNVSSDDDDDDDDSTTTATDTATAAATSSASDATGTADAVSTSTSDAFAAPTMAPAGKGAAAAVALGMLAYLV
ncbi:hypothetical protein FDECE_17577 [Fusarium decemcellulare]|nr:hypothetical protein FDECE_17577 [Fusarium decemcellulare]